MARQLTTSAPSLLQCLLLKEVVRLTCPALCLFPPFPDTSCAVFLPVTAAVSAELSKEMVALRQRLYKLKNEEKAGIPGELTSASCCLC